ncbi:hypothetical protein LTR66_015080, partial [Elasticomyces elasticus]
MQGSRIVTEDSALALLTDRACDLFTPTSTLLKVSRSSNSMACEKEEELILRILLQDLEHLEHNQRGKQREGEFSDLAIALNCMKDDCLAEQTSIEDGIMALSISTAVATDQNELASIKCEETIAEYDHQLALALEKGDSNDDDVADVSNLCDRALREVNEDPLSTVIGDLMGRMDLS